MRLHVTLCANQLANDAFWTARPCPESENYGPGVTDTEIKIGQTCRSAAPASSFGLKRQSHGCLLQDDQ